MLRVIGVTFDHRTNYGSLFQAYALKRTIEQMKVDGGCDYRLIPLWLMPHHGGPKPSVPQAVYMAAYEKLHTPPFKEFEEKYMAYADCRSLKELDALNDQADVFVCGSDVIWNTDITHGSGVWYLDFARKYKFAYAASFGKAAAGEPDEQTKEWLRQLDDISCREKSGSEMLQRIVGRPVSVSVDPVFLMRRKEWEELIRPEDMPARKHYIFAYNTYMDPNYEAFLKKLSEETSLPVIRTTWTLKNSLRQKMLTVPGPQQWLTMLAGADYVVTNSFHGTGFSILFHKKFFSVVPGGEKRGSNGRLYEVLRRTSLTDRLIGTVPGKIDTSPADFTAADEAVEEMRAESLVYLHRNLEAAYRRKQDDRQ